MSDNYYIHNLETDKLELHFARETYQSLTDEQKREIKSAFLWGRNSGCWISRAKFPNLYRAEKVAENLNLTNAGKTGERMSFAEQIENKQERAEHRAERYETYSSNAAQRAETLQKPINDMRGDIAFFTQPNINSSGGRSFTRRREKMFASYERGFDEYRKSAYYAERAETARYTANSAELENRGFVMRRIEERKKNIRALQRGITRSEEFISNFEAAEPVDETKLARYTAHYEKQLDMLEIELDKLGFYQNKFDELGGMIYSKDNIKPGYIVHISRWGACRVVSTGPKNITYIVGSTGGGNVLTAAYAEIDRIIKATETPEERHPFTVGETFTCRRWSDTERKAIPATFTIIRATDKSVTLQTGEEKPFIRKPKYRTFSNSWMLQITDWNDGIVFKQSNKQ